MPNENDHVHPVISSSTAPECLMRYSVKWLDWRYLLGVFVLVLISPILFGYSLHIPKQFDAAGYWGLAGRFIKNNHFALLNYNSALRGYLFPLLLIPFRVVDYLGKWPEGIMQLLLGAVQAALLYVWALPKLYNRIRPDGVYSAKRRILFISLGLFFWIGYFVYTLSDFPAILAFSTGLLIVLRKQPRFWFILIAGALFGAALNTRPFYLLSMPFVVLLVWKLKFNENSWCRSLLSCTCLLSGMLLILAPQFRINSVNFGHDTPLVITKLNEKDDLFLAQLAWGLKMLKVETSLGGAADGRNAQVIYTNMVGESLLGGSASLEHKSFNSIKEYIFFVGNHPIGILTTYLLHIFAGLDQHHATPYSTEDVNKFTIIISIANYSLLFIAVIILLYGNIRPLTFHQFLVMSTWLVPCIVTLAVAMENRFLLPIHLLIYSFVAFEKIEYRAMLTYLFKHKVKILTMYSIFMTLLFALSILIHNSREIFYV